MTAHEHEFVNDENGRKRCACGTYLFQHAPDHPYGSQPGPGGMYARWCLRTDCDWRETGASTVGVLLLCLIVLPLLALALLKGGERVMCGQDPTIQYCTEAGR
jgi:hypothetical protein